jgi:CopG family transcriptional regulator, nickel-responsive regulator
MENELLAGFDDLIGKRGYASRSEAIRDLVRRELVEEEWADPQAEVIGTVTLVYDHELTATLTGAQHDHHDEIVCTTHIHVDATNCMEVVVVRGPAAVVRHIGENLISRRGVKHGRLVCTTTGAQLR